MSKLPSTCTHGKMRQDAATTPKDSKGFLASARAKCDAKFSPPLGQIRSFPAGETRQDTSSPWKILVFKNVQDSLSVFKTSVSANWMLYATGVQRIRGCQWSHPPTHHTFWAPRSRGSKPELTILQKESDHEKAKHLGSTWTNSTQLGEEGTRVNNTVPATCSICCSVMRPCPSTSISRNCLSFVRGCASDDVRCRHEAQKKHMQTRRNVTKRNKTWMSTGPATLESYWCARLSSTAYCHQHQHGRLPPNP